MSDFNPNAPHALIDVALPELEALRNVHGGNLETQQFNTEFRKTLSNVVNVVRQTSEAHERLKLDDEMNPVGRDRKLAELPKNMDAITTSQLRQAEIAIDIVEARLTNQVLLHDSKTDSDLSREVETIMANVAQGDAALTLVQLAANNRYSSYLASAGGQSHAIARNVDPASLRRAGFQNLAANGNTSQRRAAADLATFQVAARRVHSLIQAEAQSVKLRITPTKRAEEDGENFHPGLGKFGKA